MSQERVPTGRSVAKRREILLAARSAFLAGGYDSTSMDDIASSAGVSKPTIYNHFGDKKGLFVASITADIDDASTPTQAMIEALPHSDDLGADLVRFARQHLTDIMQPHLVRTRRRLIGEIERFPDLAAAWYQAGPVRGHRTLAGVFSALAERGLLRIDDPMMAAEQFNALVLIPLDRAMLHLGTPSPDELNRAADVAVQTFLAAHRPMG